MLMPKSLVTGLLILLVFGVGQPEELGNPRSSYGLGSAEYLKGKNVLYSMFVDTPDSAWTEEEKEITLNKLTVAADYIEDCAGKYRTKTELIYNWKENTDLTGEKKINFSVSDDKDYVDKLDAEIAKWVKEEAEPDLLCETYKADGSALLVFIHNKGTSYAIIYDGVDNPSESAVLFHKEPAAVYAHEILHLFGAHDLYKGAEYTEEVTEYVKTAYPEEIMFTVESELAGESSTKISQEISVITAYHLGWMDYTEEIDVFPQLVRKKNLLKKKIKE